MTFVPETPFMLISRYRLVTVNNKYVPYSYIYISCFLFLWPDHVCSLLNFSMGLGGPMGYSSD